MNSAAFKRALSATGYVTREGGDLPGLHRPGADAPSRVRGLLSVSSEARVGLKPDAIFTAQNAPASIFKDAGGRKPDETEFRRWHETAWNLGVAPLLWIVTPTDVRLYDCYSSPGAKEASRPLDTFALDDAGLRRLDEAAGRLATETGAFWESVVGRRIDRRHRVDRELLAELAAMEDALTEVPSRKPPTSPAGERHAARAFAQRLIGRCIFVSYLLDRELLQKLLPPALPADSSKLFSNPKVAFALFTWLRQTFNGDLFPMDDPGEARQRLSQQHLDVVLDFLEGRSLVPGLSDRLFKFRFNAIPVDLISSVYQQFARSAAQDDARRQGLHYTPIELVHLTLDPVFEALPADATVLDPTCGSGAFLVEAFRRLVWKKARGKPASRKLVRSILYGQLFGIDINRSALAIAAFSLYLAALEFDDEPIVDARDLKFDRLIGETLFEADTLELDSQPTVLKGRRTFDAVVGNPPWTYDREQLRARDPHDSATARPRRSPDQAFLGVAASLAGESGKIGMILKATPFFSLDDFARAAREPLLQQLAPVALVNLSALREYGLFPEARAPALLFFSRCALMQGPRDVLTGSIPWTPDFPRSGKLSVGADDFRTVPLAGILRTPKLLKATTFGTSRDGWLIERLEREFPAFETLLLSLGVEREVSRGQGFKVKGAGQQAPPSEFRRLKVLTPPAFRPFRLQDRDIQPFEHATLHRPRTIGIYRGPLLLCPKGSLGASSQQGRYSAALHSEDLLYTENFFGISLRGLDPRLGGLLSAVLNSCLTSFQLAFGGGTWGLERTTVAPGDLLALRVPDLEGLSASLLERLRVAESAAAAAPESASALAELDAAVGAAYGLEPDEFVVASESVERARPLISDARSERMRMLRPPEDALQGYAQQVLTVVNRYLRARGERHLVATAYSSPFASDSSTAGASLSAVRFSMVPGPPTDSGTVQLRSGHQEELVGLAEVLSGRVRGKPPPYLNERRQLRLYFANDLFVVKPREVRYWTRTAGLNDADVILADHWIGARDAAGR